MTFLFLTQDKVAVIDDCDWDLVGPYSWIWESSKMKSGYAIAQVNVGRKGAKRGVRRKRTKILLHNLIGTAMRLAGPEIDHIDGNGLNNSRSNLRSATRSQQCQNRSKIQIPSSSKFKGVQSWKGRWRARITLHGVSTFLGYFDSEEKAAIAYNAAAVKAFGDFAKLNEVSQ